MPSMWVCWQAPYRWCACCVRCRYVEEDTRSRSRRPNAQAHPRQEAQEEGRYLLGLDPRRDVWGREALLRVCRDRPRKARNKRDEEGLWLCLGSDVCPCENVTSARCIPSVKSFSSTRVHGKAGVGGAECCRPFSCRRPWRSSRAATEGGRGSTARRRTGRRRSGPGAP